MNTTGTVNNKVFLRILLSGAFLILIVNFSISLSAFLSKTLSVYFFDNIFIASYFFIFFLVGIVSVEIITLNRKYKTLFLKKSFKKIVFVILFLYMLNAICVYIEGRVLAIYIAENYSHKEILHSFTISQNAKTAISLNSFILIIFSIYKLWR